MNNIEKNLRDWGMAQQTLPANYQLMKNEVISKLKPAATAAARSPMRLTWLSFALAGLAVVAFIVMSGKNITTNSLSSKQTSSPLADAVSPKGSNGAAKMGIATAPTPASPPQAINNSLSGQSAINEGSYPYFPQPREIPASDTRQFIKTDYSASVKTRDVQELIQRIQTTVRGFDGRVDSVGNSSESGFVGFVIPASQLEAFKLEIKNISGGAKFYTETLSSQNMLSSKRSLEDQQTQTQTNLNQLNANKDQLTQTHNKIVASINSQLSADAKETDALRQESQNIINYNRQQQIQARLVELQNQTKDLKNRLANENTNYQNQLDSLNYQIQDWQTSLDQLGKQTGELLDTVATVSGTIAVSYISLWGVLGLYLGNYWVVYLLLIAAALAYYVNRRRFSLLDV